jgi:hypothetical protein
MPVPNGTTKPTVSESRRRELARELMSAAGLPEVTIAADPDLTRVTIDGKNYPVGAVNVEEGSGLAPVTTPREKTAGPPSGPVQVPELYTDAGVPGGGSGAGAPGGKELDRQLELLTIAVRGELYVRDQQLDSETKQRVQRLVDEARAARQQGTGDDVRRRLLQRLRRFLGDGSLDGDDNAAGNPSPIPGTTATNPPIWGGVS